MTARDYYRSVLQLLTTSAIVSSQHIEFDEQDIYVAYLKGAVSIVDGSTLFFAQYVQIEGALRDQINREKYRHHWQAPDEKTRRRWDNAPHHPGLATFPYHLHVGVDEEVRESSPADLWQVISQIEKES